MISLVGQSINFSGKSWYDTWSVTLKYFIDWILSSYKSILRGFIKPGGKISMMDPLIENWPLKDTCSVLSYPISTKKFLKASKAVS